ncbi:hypothetical protein SeMB42_g07711 [Synchytrium endobioticum]|uniref:Uncharacterized protein n=1 Tax=Synchytrium endobioticum TaxID=286115 RepID=A0A507BRI3_9FUNG|nr:hypothetical protein SeMB42_g07711 [Synchytrium endobioticum]
MGKKKKNEIKPWCWYCDREFDDEKVLINHQKAKHLKCSICNKKLNTAGGLIIHTNQVHKESLTKVPNALPGRDDPNIEIFGMEGVPEPDMQAHLAELDAASGNPSSKRPKVAVLDDDQIKAQLSHWRAAQDAFGMPNHSSTGAPFPNTFPPSMPGMPVVGTPPIHFAPPYPMMPPPHMPPMMPGGPMPPYGQPPLPHMMSAPHMMQFGMPPRPGVPPMPFGMPQPGAIGAPPFLPPPMGGPPPLPSRSLESGPSSTGTPPTATNGISHHIASTGESNASVASHQTSAVSDSTGAVPVRQPGEQYLVYPDNDVSVEEKRAQHPKYRYVEGNSAVSSATATNNVMIVEVLNQKYSAPNIDADACDPAVTETHNQTLRMMEFGGSDQHEPSIPTSSMLPVPDTPQDPQQHLPADQSPLKVASDDQLITQVTLKNGQVYRINDHVYLASELPQEAYLTGRIMQFVQDKTSSSMMVRVGWYYRPRDVIFGGRRKHYDSKLLVASQHSDLNPVAAIRGICQIKHLNHIHDLEKYKAQDDCFYFHQLYDRYTHRLYDVVPFEECKHLPHKVRERLSDVPYVLVEAGKAAEFTDRRRACVACSKWCQIDDCIRCAHCGDSYHLLCVDMEKKPSKGYAWQCPRCLKASRTVPEEVAGDALTHANTARPVRKRKHIWPFHYLGDYSRLDAADDEEDDKGFPKARSRVGDKYQAEMPLFGEEAEAADGAIDESILSQPSQSRGGNRGKRKPPAKKIQIDGDVDSTAERASSDVLLFVPDKLSVEELDKYLDDATKLFPASIDVPDRALEVLHRCNYNTKDAFKIMSKLTLTDVRISEWTPEENKRFEASITKYGHDLYWVQKEVYSKSMKEVVIFFYKWKRTDRYQPVYSQFCEKYRPGKKFKALNRAPLVDPEDEKAGDDVDTDASSDLSELSLSDSDEDEEINAARAKSKKECANCLTGKSTKWHVRQLYGSTQHLCEDCATYWLKYAGTRPVTETVKKHNREKYSVSRPTASIPVPPKRKREEEVASNDVKPPKKTKGSKKQVEVPEAPLPTITIKPPAPPVPEIPEPELPSTIPQIINDEPPEPLPPQPVPCGVCREWSNHPNNPLVACMKCHLRVHPSCYGIPDRDIAHALRRWICSRCANTGNPDAALTYNCAMCPTQLANYDSAIKKTIGKNWVHAACAVWTPEVRFGNVEIMEPVEGVGLINKQRWTMNCTICHQQYGTCVSCYEPGCTKSFHVTCGQIAGFDFTFEEDRQPGVIPPPGQKRELNAEVYCNEHRRNPYINFSLPPATMLPQNQNSNTAPPETRSTDMREYVLAKKAGILQGTLGERKSLASSIRTLCTCHLVTEAHRQSQQLNTGDDTKPASTDQTATSLPPQIPITYPVTAPDPVGGRRICIRCSTMRSPIWWLEEEALNGPDYYNGEDVSVGNNRPLPSGRRVCHVCYFKIRDQISAAESLSAISSGVGNCISEDAREVMENDVEGGSHNNGHAVDESAGSNAQPDVLADRVDSSKTILDPIAAAVAETSSS